MPDTRAQWQHGEVGRTQTLERVTWFGLLAPILTNSEISGKSLTVFSFSFLTYGGMIITNLLLRGLEIIFTEHQA